jgi:hypothetical protein
MLWNRGRGIGDALGLQWYGLLDAEDVSVYAYGRVVYHGLTMDRGWMRGAGAASRAKAEREQAGGRHPPSKGKVPREIIAVHPTPLSRRHCAEESNRTTRPLAPRPKGASVVASPLSTIVAAYALPSLCSHTAVTSSRTRGYSHHCLPECGLAEKLKSWQPSPTHRHTSPATRAPLALLSQQLPIYAQLPQDKAERHPHTRHERTYPLTGQKRGVILPSGSRAEVVEDPYSFRQS